MADDGGLARGRGDDHGSSASGASLVEVQRDLWFRVAALAGAATLPLIVTASTISDVAGSGGLNPGSSDAQLLRVFGEFRDRHLVASALFAVAAVAMLTFVGPLWVRLRTGSEFLAVVAVGGGVAVAVLLLAWAGASLSAVVAADYGDAGAARFLMVSGWEGARLSVGPYMAMVGAATVAGYRHRVFSRPFNVFGLVFTVLLAFGLLPASPAGLMGMLATLWVACAAPVIAFSTSPALRRRAL